ncbi:MAG: kinase [Alphaproteobacteria bacterium]|nr:kinase [Alphaproteobacteria bacterium]
MQTLPLQAIARALLRRRPRILGLQGAQGTGKSTLARALEPVFAAEGCRVVTLGLDDLYLPRASRLQRAAEVHPLLRTRGVPGTHDVDLAHRLLDELLWADRPGDRVELPVFDKGTDDRAPTPRVVEGPVDAVLLEGWCVGLPPLPSPRLLEPGNALERTLDTDGRWRRHVQAQLMGPYAGLWDRLDALAVLLPPSWDTVRRWRRDQELPLRERGAPEALDDAALDRFLAHYERWTRWGLEVLPERADVVVGLDEDHGLRFLALP